MFTIKHIASHSFDEFIWEAPAVRHGISPATSKPTISFETTEHGPTGTIDSGIVYVMNRFGATIAKYDFHGPTEGGARPESAYSMQQS